MSQPAALKFELASHEIVELLVGNKIYDNPPWVVVRELLQNAVDACRLRRALQPDYAPLIRFAYTPPAAGAPGRLRVVDNGIGMSDFILRGYFLRVGRSYYSSSDFRARYGEQSFSPIARFGVGVLSCFLVADQVTVTTRHLDPGSPAISLVIENLHSLLGNREPGDPPVGTELVLDLASHVAYPDLAAIVRHWARHVEIPIEVLTGDRLERLPPDDGAAFSAELLDPAHYVVLNPMRIGVLKTRRIQFDAGGLQGFFEYPYLESQGRIRRFDSAEGKGIIELYADKAPQAICLDGVYVGNRLPTALPGLRVPYTAFELNVDSRQSGLSLRLDRQQFVEDEKFRQFLARLDQAVLDDLVALVQGFDLTPVQLADTLADLLQMRQVVRAGSAVAKPVWEAVAALPVFPLRQDGQRRFLTWPEFSAQPQVARLPVGDKRVTFPGQVEDMVEDFWWARQHMLCTRMDPSIHFLTTFDTTELVDAFLEQSCCPVAVALDSELGLSYRLFAPASGQAAQLANMAVLPFAGQAEALLTWADGWVLNASHPFVRAVLSAAPGSAAQRDGVKAFRDLRAQLRSLPTAADARLALAAAGRALGAATGLVLPACQLPAHDTVEYFDAQWQRFIIDGGVG